MLRCNPIENLDRIGIQILELKTKLFTLPFSGRAPFFVEEIMQDPRSRISELLQPLTSKLWLGRERGAERTASESDIGFPVQRYFGLPKTVTAAAHRSRPHVAKNSKFSGGTDGPIYEPYEHTNIDDTRLRVESIRSYPELLPGLYPIFKVMRVLNLCSSPYVRTERRPLGNSTDKAWKARSMLHTRVPEDHAISTWTSPTEFPGTESTIAGAAKLMPALTPDNASKDNQDVPQCGTRDIAMESTSALNTLRGKRGTANPASTSMPNIAQNRGVESLGLPNPSNLISPSGKVTGARMVKDASRLAAVLRTNLVELADSSISSPVFDTGSTSSSKPSPVSDRQNVTTYSRNNERPTELLNSANNTAFVSAIDMQDFLDQLADELELELIRTYGTAVP